MNRRGFLKLLGGAAAAVATPHVVRAAQLAVAEPEPVRRYWQVGRGAPVRDHGFGDRLAWVHLHPGRDGRVGTVVATSDEMPNPRAMQRVRDEMERLCYDAPLYTDYDDAPTLFAVDHSSTPLWSGTEPQPFSREHLRAAVEESERRQRAHPSETEGLNVSFPRDDRTELSWLTLGALAK